MDNQPNENRKAINNLFTRRVLEINAKRGVPGKVDNNNIGLGGSGILYNNSLNIFYIQYLWENMI